MVIFTDPTFSLSILTILIEEQRRVYKNIHNKNIELCNLKFSDVVKSHIQVQDIASKGIISKIISYSKGSVIITDDLGHNCFDVKWYRKPSSDPIKNKNNDFFLPPILFPLKYCDTINQWCLECSYTHFNSLSKYKRLDLYNNKWLKSSIIPVRTFSIITGQPSNECNTITFSLHKSSIDTSMWN